MSLDIKKLVLCSSGSFTCANQLIFRFQEDSVQVLAEKWSSTISPGHKQCNLKHQPILTIFYYISRTNVMGVNNHLFTRFQTYSMTQNPCLSLPKWSRTWNQIGYLLLFIILLSEHNNKETSNDISLCPQISESLYHHQEQFFFKQIPNTEPYKWAICKE